MVDVLTNLKENWVMMELENSINKVFHDYGPEGTKIFSVSGQQIRNTFMNHMKTDFIGGGHHYAYSFIPLEEIWIDNEVSTDEQRFFLAHEMTERMLMKHLHKKYPDSHNIANTIEMKLRAHEEPENVFNSFCNEHFKQPELKNMGRQLTLAYLGF
jgi:hypothetical protein